MLNSNLVFYCKVVCFGFKDSLGSPSTEFNTINLHGESGYPNKERNLRETMVHCVQLVGGRLAQ